MDTQIFDIETWRGDWFYKFGSRYTGPFERRQDAVAAASRDLAPLTAPQPAPMRGSLEDPLPARSQTGGDAVIGARRRSR